MMRLGLSLFCVVSLLVGCDSGEDDTDRRETMISEGGPLSATIASVQGANIHYEVAGSGSPAVVLVHGWSCDRRYWDAQFSTLAEHYQVVRIDLAGHGDSDARDDLSMAAFGADVAAVVDALDLTSVVLVGHSMGGPVVLEAAPLLGDRLRGLVGVDTLKSIGRSLPDEQVAEFRRGIAEDFSGTVAALVGNTMFVPESDESLKAWIVKDMSSAPPEVGTKAVFELNRFDPLPLLEALDVPMALVNASQPPSGIEPIVERVDDFQLLEYDDAGHFLMMERPERFNRDLMVLIEEFER